MSNVVTKRPAESVSAAAGTGGIIAAISTHNWLAVGIAAVGFLPAVTTYIVTNGGLSGVLRSFWGGKK